MNVGIIGKTGSGKTTVAALVAMACATRGGRVVAVDTDANPNLGLSLGAPSTLAERAVPRALARGRGGGALTVEELLRGYAVPTPSGVTLLHAMPASEEIAGCGCPAHASAHSLLASALRAFDVAVVDMEAGLDHLNRREGTLAHADVVLVVVDASRKSLVTGGRMVERALASGIAAVAVVGNKAVEGDDAVFAELAREHGVAVAGAVPLSSAIAEADRSGTGVELGNGPERAAAEAIAATLVPTP